jgi:hypothetical protein
LYNWKTYLTIAAFSLRFTCVFIQTGLQRSAPVWSPEAEGEGSGLIDGFITDYCGIFKNADSTVLEDVGIKLRTVAAL